MEAAATVTAAAQTPRVIAESSSLSKPNQSWAFKPSLFVSEEVNMTDDTATVFRMEQVCLAVSGLVPGTRKL